MKSVCRFKIRLYVGPLQSANYRKAFALQTQRVPGTGRSQETRSECLSKSLTFAITYYPSLLS